MVRIKIWSTFVDNYMASIRISGRARLSIDLGTGLGLE
jgi:hypothetical protein